MSIVLLYHRLGLPRPASIVAGQYVAPFLFRSELNHLMSRGFKSVSLNQAVAEPGTPSAKLDSFALTFDDGYLSVYQHAYPALLDRKMTATVFVVADHIGGSNVWDKNMGDVEEQMMSAAHIQELAQQGFEIGSHTLSHPHLTAIPEEQMLRELVDSRRRLEDLIGREVRSLSYPYGDFDGRIVEAAGAAGYKTAVTTRLGVITNRTSHLEIPRVNVRWNALGPILMRKILRAAGISSGRR